MVLFFLIAMFPVCLWAQVQDTTKKDSVINQVDTLTKQPANDTTAVQLIVSTPKTDTTLKSLLKENKFLNTTGAPASLAVKTKKSDSDDVLFYLLAGLVLILAIFKFFFARYFTTLFRVFFNTSLRQSQLTDQLLQAKLPSLLYNFFFILSAGVYVYFLLFHYQWVTQQNRWLIMGLSVATLSIIYLVKFCTLKFTGWITGYTESTNIYVFIIFLINKIMGIFLVPFTVIIAFALPSIAHTAVLISLLCVGLLFVLRFFRSYGLIQHQLKISRLHFFLYILGIEILPLLLIYKALILLLNKNL